jgi:nucleoside-diphosphate-sugar epimerase
MSEPLTLVTGGAGYVGSVLVGELRRAGRRIRILDSLLHGAAPDRAAPDAPEFVHGDVRNAADRQRALEGVAEVVHLAAIVGDPACSRHPAEAESVNLDATRELVRDAHRAGARRLVFASTCSNYGKIENGEPATEEWDLHPISLYAETKVAAELDVLANGDSGFATTCLRFATIYGASPRMRFDLTVNEFTREIVLGQELVVYGEQFWRPYVHTADAARAIALVLDAPVGLVEGQVFNVGDSAENYRKLDLVALLRERAPGATISFVQRDEDPRDYRVSFDKIRDRLGYAVSSTVPQGIDEVAALIRSGQWPDPYADTYRN